MNKARVGKRLRAQVFADAAGRCGYCQSSEEITGTALEIEHLVPEIQGGLTVRENLWAACRQCNVLKGDRMLAVDPLTGEQVSLFNPRREAWASHFAWEDSGRRIAGQTPAGRATVVALSLNRALLTRARTRWIAAGWHPPTARQ
jgi:hypothetical protein